MQVSESNSNPSAIQQRPPAKSAVVLSARGLVRDWGRRRVLDGIDADLRTGEVVALSGANGAGKTTLLRCLAGLLRCASGELLWFGRSARSSIAHRARIGFTCHETCLYAELTARENLLFSCRICGVHRPAARADDLIALAQLQHCANRPCGTLSRGMRQRLAVVRALASEPDILLFDEPSTGLDVAGRQWLADLLRNQRGLQRAVCFSSHDREFSQPLADHWWYMERGRLVCSEPGPNDRAAGGGVVRRSA